MSDLRIKVKIRCPISPEMEKGMTNLIKQTKDNCNPPKKRRKMDVRSQKNKKVDVNS